MHQGPWEATLRQLNLGNEMSIESGSQAIANGVEERLREAANRKQRLHECLHRAMIVRLHTCVLMELPVSSWFGQVIAINAIQFVFSSVVPPHCKLDPLTISVSQGIFESIAWRNGGTTPHERIGSQDGVDVPANAQVVRELDLSHDIGLIGFRN